MTERSIVELLATARGQRRSGAEERAIAGVEAHLGRGLPEDCRSFLLWSNGWEGTLGATWLVLDGTDAMIGDNDPAFRAAFPGFVAIGGNGGLETYALDYRQGETPTGLYALDQISADDEDRWLIGPSMTESFNRLLIQPLGPWD